MNKPFHSNYSFHSHTFRCGHATGDIEDYVMEAIKNKITTYGVSDHVFLPGVSQPTVRGDFSLLDNYVETFHSVKEIYKDFITLYLGFECEYAPMYLEYYKSLLTSETVEYLICGQHCTFDDNRNAFWYFGYYNMNNFENIERYKDDVILAMKSGLFFYIAHPDLFMYTITRITPDMDRVINEIVDASIKYDIPLEMNISGFGRIEADKEHGTLGYPNEYFWKTAQQKGAKIIFGGDYHKPEAIDNKRFEKLFGELIKKTGVVFVDEKAEFQKYLNKIKNQLL